MSILEMIFVFKMDSSGNGIFQWTLEKKIMIYFWKRFRRKKFGDDPFEKEFSIKKKVSKRVS